MKLVQLIEARSGNKVDLICESKGRVQTRDVNPKPENRISVLKTKSGFAYSVNGNPLIYSDLRRPGSSYSGPPLIYSAWSFLRKKIADHVGPICSIVIMARLRTLIRDDMITVR